MLHDWVLEPVIFRVDTAYSHSINDLSISEFCDLNTRGTFWLG